MNKLEKIVGILMLLFAVGYNLWIYKLEPTAKIDPNDNPFQFALVYRTNEMWDFASSHCPKNLTFIICHLSVLSDHWVPNWAEGFNLPYYYSHAPQIAIVGSYRILHSLSALSPQLSAMSLFNWYHIVIYLLLCLFPIAVFWGLKVIKVPWYVAGFGAIAATQLSTDGLYGLDPSSFLWRGYGLSSQLFSMIFLPMAIAYSYQFLVEELQIKKDTSQIKTVPHNHWSLIIEYWSLLTRKSSFLPAVLFITLSIMGHLGIGVLALLSVGMLAISFPIIAVFNKQSLGKIIKIAWEKIWRLGILSVTALTLLSYWIVPVFINAQYHNISFWDPVWKFNSWGWKDVMQQFFNGNLFDFGRLPILTMLCILGGFAVILVRDKRQGAKDKNLTSDPLTSVPNLAPFALMFIFWLLMFFGRATWGGIIDLIPSMKDFHQSRFIVGLHLAGFFLAPIGFWYFSEWAAKTTSTVLMYAKQLLHTLDTEEEPSSKSPIPNSKFPLSGVNQIPNSTLLIVSIILTVLLFLILSPQTNAYASYNDFLIKRGNDNFDKQDPDVAKLITTLKALPPGRVFPGRGGSWGKKLEISETTYFMHLSTYGIPVILWLPETWSPMSDVEQFFIEENQDLYNLFNVKYVVTPPDLAPQPFWKLITQTPSWKLYSVATEGYFTTGGLSSIVETKKEYYVNLVRLWLQSDYPKNKVFPQITFNHQEMLTSPRPAFKMIDEATYQTRDNKLFGLFGDVPKYEAPKPDVTLVGPEQTDHDMIFKTTVKVGPNCKSCLVILKQSFHPEWKAWVNGKPAKNINIFPFYSAVEVSQPGINTIEFRYEPSLFKLITLTFGILLFIFLYFPWTVFLKDKLHTPEPKPYS